MPSASKLPIPDLTFTIDRFDTLVYCHFNKPTGFIAHRPCPVAFFKARRLASGYA